MMAKMHSSLKNTCSFGLCIAYSGAEKSTFWALRSTSEEET